MKNFDIKFREIFIPYLIISSSTIISYSLLRWLLFIKSNAMVVDEDILNFWAPCFYILITVYVWLGQRIKILDLTPKGYRSAPFAGLLLLAGMTILAPTVIAQFYLETATGKLTQLERISQIDSVTQTKFYSVKTFYADKQLARFKSRFVISNKSSDFDMYIYAVVPLYNSNHASKFYNYRIGVRGDSASMNNALMVVNGKPCSKDTLKLINPRGIKNIRILKGKIAKKLYGNNALNGAILIETVPYAGPDTMQVVHDENGNYKPYAWLATRYLKTIRNKLSQGEKDQAYAQFAKESQADFNAKPFDKLAYMDRVPYGDDMKKYLAAINAENYSPVSTPQNIMTPVYDPFEKRNGDKLPWIFGSFSIGSVFFLFLLLFKPLRVDVAAEINKSDKTQQIVDDLTGKSNN